MLNKLKKLEALVKSSADLIRKLEDDNAVLRQQVQSLNENRQKILKDSAGARELAQFKDKVRKKLTRINARIEKVITLQDTLFGEDFDDAQ